MKMSNNKQSSDHIGETNKKVSSVEWLMEIDKSRAITIEEWQQAKAMHKEEIMEAWDNAAIDATYGNKFSNPEQYYNETFNTKER